jgi:excisionase family DNA binding protein
VESVEDVGLETLDLLRAREVAALLKISERQAWRLIKDKKIRSIRIGAGVRVTRAALAAYIHQCEEAADAAEQHPRAS